MMKRNLERVFTFVTTLVFISFITNIQAQEFSRQDTLRGSITPERAWWDLVYYHLDITVHPESKSIEGKNTVRYKVIDGTKRMQIDLQAPLELYKATQNGEELTIDHEGNAHFIHLKEAQEKGDVKEVVVYYRGVPVEAVRPPWDGGITWRKDEMGNPFIASSCQGIGASVWWPCKDHMYDEVDSMMISVNVPKELMNISNGRLVKVEKGKKKTKTYHWFVSNPINNYGVNINIGNYVHFGEKYEGEKGTLDMDYYVLEHNLEKAKLQFKDARRTIEAFEHWFGPYPFYEDSYKLVEAPYLGMEHQSSVTYGNGYQNGYRGRDLSGSGWGLKFDFIIVHESGHEWFANNITYKDIADMWVHESFTNYSEGLFVEHFYGKEAGAEYVIGTRSNIQNDIPVIGPYDVNQRGSGDMYYKGGNMLHTIRQLVKNDEKWRQLLRGLNKEFYHQTVTTKQVEDYMIRELGLDLKPIFDQYLRTTMVPTFEYIVKDGKIHFKWNNCVKYFNMPVKIWVDGKPTWLNPVNEWKSEDLPLESSSVEVDPNFYIGILNY
ncbi:M1 family metallopeptidase [Rapidithrix thailandica]|uniref:M1 family metallopeptidase n=1 Tax=Rapidithrix thailandica TaxID=413964 RepID=A0AAW9SJ46_9BACT